MINVPPYTFSVELAILIPSTNENANRKTDIMNDKYKAIDCSMVQLLLIDEYYSL